MRFVAATLVIAAVLAINEAPSTLLGQSIQPPCEAARRASPSRSRPAGLSAPSNLRTVPTSEVKNARAQDPTAGSGNRPDRDPHTYFVALASRADCFAAYSLRDAPWVAANRSKQKDPPQLLYLYPSDPDRRQQDALKIWIREGESDVIGTMTVSIGPTRGQNLLFTHDVWFGNEWHHDRTLIQVYKETPISFHAQGIGGFVDMRINFLEATRHVDNQPPGGPYVAFPFVHLLGKRSVVPGYPISWMSEDGPTRNDQVRFPKDASAHTQQREYGNEALAPHENEFGLVGERWHRYWHFFERDPSRDWVSTSKAKAFAGKPMSAYKYSVWGADTERGPVQLVNERTVGIPAEYTHQITTARFTFGCGNACRDSSALVGRGDVISYARNWVALHGTSKTDVLALLERPVN